MPDSNKNQPGRTYTVDLEPVGRRIQVSPGENLLEAAQKAGVDLVTACGGVGICASCLVRLVAGDLSKPTITEEMELSAEMIADGFRLACQAEPISDVRIDIPPESLPAAQKMQVDGQENILSLDPAVIAVDLSLQPPTLEDLRSDLTRVEDALNETGFSPLRADLAVLSELSKRLREQDWSVRLALRPMAEENQGARLIAALKPGKPLLGLAVDMGSTKLAVYLVDLDSGTTLAKSGVMNPQIAYGEDVVSRIAFANKSEANRRLLQTRLTDTLNDVTGQLCREVGASTEQIVDAVLVGNTAMHHFFSSLPVEQLGAAPYIPAVSEPLESRAAEVGLDIAPGARFYLPANIAGYVGADHTSALLATQAYNNDQSLVLVDIGTNTEISLVHQGKIVTCSTASGPAFEGAHIHDGMRAAPGAIERVAISGGQVQTFTIGGKPPVGICGTGILTALSQMLDSGALDHRGAFNKQDAHVRMQDGHTEYLLAAAAQTGHGRDIVVTRKDVHEIQLAKGAIRAGIEILLEEAGLRPEDVQAWVIAGAFGTFLDLSSAQRVGMFPAVPLERFRQVGNAAGVGAKEMLLSRSKRVESTKIVSQVQYIELTIYPEFTHRFVDAMYF